MTEVTTSGEKLVFNSYNFIGFAMHMLSFIFSFGNLEAFAYYSIQ